MLDLTFGRSFKVKRWFTGLVSCLSGGYKFASVLRCVGLVVCVYVEMLPTTHLVEEQAILNAV